MNPVDATPREVTPPLIDTLLLDVDGVLQFPRAAFVAAIEHDYAWKSGFLAFQHELINDPAEARALVGDGELIRTVPAMWPAPARPESRPCAIEATRT
ncbi:hypothetical protein JIG36_10470 [Actinoplanes sp. LDG1-06]|uniref:Uncharacterized protein n=1 Tax=Paractinoplanes ovalisporus TaxID=2810368 RepID=A0ABS2A8B0_9ACTN|nr:hypothetical protein [Actinoplanes ovalisporus]MBM2615980.1 hypothetical protein [Actinoplanes ovalisporus]